jgi:hypothetical protein
VLPSPDDRGDDQEYDDSTLELVLASIARRHDLTRKTACQGTPRWMERRFLGRVSEPVATIAVRANLTQLTIDLKLMYDRFAIAIGSDEA